MHINQASLCYRTVLRVDERVSAEHSPLCPEKKRKEASTRENLPNNCHEGAIPFGELLPYYSLLLVVPSMLIILYNLYGKLKCVCLSEDRRHCLPIAEIRFDERLPQPFPQPRLV
jgi:hypothetical protein